MKPDPLIISDEQEINLILRHREAIKKSQELIEKQKQCEHDMVYIGHSHNDDVYECWKCGYI